MRKIVPHLWYDSDAEEAVRLYADLVRDSRIGAITRYPKTGFAIHGRPEGSVLTVDVTLGDTRVMALNGGPHFRFTPAISLFVILESEAAVDRLWSGLAEGSEVLMPLDRYDWSPKYGWLADRWGLTWQVALGKHADTGRTVTLSLLFSGQNAGRAEVAIEHYTSVFPSSRIEGILRHDGSGPDPAGTGVCVRLAPPPRPDPYYAGAAAEASPTSSRQSWRALPHPSAQRRSRWRDLQRPGLAAKAPAPLPPGAEQMAMELQCLSFRAVDELVDGLVAQARRRTCLLQPPGDLLGRPLIATRSIRSRRDAGAGAARQRSSPAMT